MRYCLLVFAFVLFSFTGYSQCTMSVNIGASNPSICSGNPVLLTANITGGTGPFTFVWSTGESSQSINVNKEGTYKVTVTDKTPGCSGVSQSIIIAVSATPPPPNAQPQLVCPNTSATLHASGSSGTYEWYDSQTDGKFLGSGDTFVTPPITSGTTFYVQTTVNGCPSLRTGVFVNATSGPTAKDVEICAGYSATLTATGGDSYRWYDNPSASGAPISTSATLNTPPLNNTTTYYVVAVLNGCVSAPTPVKANVTAAPSVPVAAPVSICSGSAATLHANPGPGIFAWYDSPTSTKALIYSPDFTTPPLTQSRSYWVEHDVNDCQSARTEVKVTVTPIPAAPGDQTVQTCINSSVQLAASAAPPAGYVYNWYTLPEGGTSIHAGNTFQTPVLNSNTTYYVEAEKGSCPSPRSAINVVVNQPPSAPSVSGPIICNGATATLTPTGPGGTYNWYAGVNDTTPLFKGSPFITPPLTVSTKFYVEAVVAGCVSPRIGVTVTVNRAVPPPTARPVSTCSGSSATLTASGGGTYEWFDSQTSTTALGSGQAFTTPALTANTTYYVQTTVGDCTSQRTSVLVTVNPTPADPTVSAGPTICMGSPATLTASAPAGSIEWYDAPTGGNRVKVGTTFTTSPSVTTDYYVQTVLGQCISNRVKVTITVTSPIKPQFKYPSGSVCKGVASITPVVYNPAGGTFTATAGLIINPNDGTIDIAHSPPGLYTVTFAGNGTCAAAESTQFRIYLTADASFTYKAVYCQDENNPRATLGPNSSYGTFTASSPDLVFVNTSNGEIDLKNSKPGTYTITNTIPALGGCNSDTKTFVVTIDSRVVISAGPDQTVAAGTPVQLAGSVGNAAGTWSGGLGHISDKTIPNPIYTPAAGETTATLTYTSTKPVGTCNAKTDKMVITFKPAPAAPTVTGNSTCMGSSATLTAIAPGGTYKWYTQPTGGAAFYTGAVFTTPALTGNATYYVESVNNIGTAGPRATVLVTVNNVPPTPVVPVTPICAGNRATLTPNDQNGTFEWFDVAVGGSPIATSAVFVTPQLLSNQTYYVEQTVGGCTSPRAQIDVTVLQAANVTSRTSDIICSGNALNYTITSDNPAATFVWSRAAVAGISNPAVSNQSSANITETLINTSPNPVTVTYILAAYNGTCPGPTASYKVIVYPTPQITGTLTPPPICNKAPVNYTINFNTAANFSWSRAAIPGIQNAAVSGQTTPTIREALINNSNAPIEVTYIISATTGTCTGADAELKITVNPSVKINDGPNPIQACSGQPLGYQITSNVPTATYSWSRERVSDVDNPAVSNQTSSLINEVLKNTAVTPRTVVYKIIPLANGCPGDPYYLVVSLNPQPAKPIANSNSPICVGSTIHLATPDVANATFQWTGPNGYSSNLQNPDIVNATTDNIGDYNLIVTVNGCQSETSTASVIVRTPGIANAGEDKIVCITDPEIILKGEVIGGAGTGIWSTTGSGTFDSLTKLDAHYTPSAADRAAGIVTFTLTTTSDDDCAISTDDVIFHFGPLPAVSAGDDQAVCSQTPQVQLHGSPLLPTTLASWSTSGTGSFSSPTDYNAIYFPSAADATVGSVNLILNVTNPGSCQVATDTMVVKFIPPAEIHAEKIRYVLKDRTITLHPTINDPNVTYLWTPNIDIDDNTLKNPTITGVTDRTYKLTVTDSRGCMSQDSTIIKVSPKVVIPNTFTPNNDGVNDLWNIQGLVAYTDATVDIFTRYGQKVYHSTGYDKPWDGMYNGKQLPTGVYYYVIDTKLFNQVLSGNVALLR